MYTCLTRLRCAGEAGRAGSGNEQWTLRTTGRSDAREPAAVLRSPAGVTCVQRLVSRVLHATAGAGLRVPLLLWAARGFGGFRLARRAVPRRFSQPEAHPAELRGIGTLAGADGTDSRGRAVSHTATRTRSAAVAALLLSPLAVAPEQAQAQASDPSLDVKITYVDPVARDNSELPVTWNSPSKYAITSIPISGLTAGEKVNFLVTPSELSAVGSVRPGTHRSAGRIAHRQHGPVLAVRRRGWQRSSGRELSTERHGLS